MLSRLALRHTLVTFLPRVSKSAALVMKQLPILLLVAYDPPTILQRLLGSFQN